MVEYEELFGGKSSVVCMAYKNQRQVGIIIRRGSKNDAFMIPIKAAKETIEELKQAIEEVENGITK